jgi:hypothetical protein
LPRLTSVPLSGFLNLSAVSWHHPSFAALFHATTVPGILPSELSPRRNRAPLSRPLAPLQLSTDVPERTLRNLVTVSFTRRPRLHALAWIPGRLWLLFQRRSTSRVTWIPACRTARFRQLRLLRSLDPPANPFSTDPSCPEPTADALLGFCPSRAFSSLALDPRTRPGRDLSTRHCPKAPTRDSRV